MPATYLFYLEAGGRVVTDTYNESVETAIDQADYERIGLTWHSLSDE